MQLGTFAITVPMDRFRLFAFLTVLSLPRSTKAWCDTTVCNTRSRSAKRFQQFSKRLWWSGTCAMQGSTCQLLLLCSSLSGSNSSGSNSSGSNSSGILQKGTGVYFCVRWRRNLIGFDFTVGKVRSLPRKMQSECLNAVADLPVPALWKAISIIPKDKKKKVGPVEIEGIGAKTIVKFTFIAMTYPHGGPWHSQVVCGRSRKGVTVNNKSGTTCMNTKQLLKGSSLVIKLIQRVP